MDGVYPHHTRTEVWIGFIRCGHCEHEGLCLPLESADKRWGIKLAWATQPSDAS